MRALLDTDVILDLLLDRQPFTDAAAELWKANEQNKFEGYISAITPVNVFYIARKIKGVVQARQTIVELLAAFRVCPVDLIILQAAIAIPMVDYEDAVQNASAAYSQLDAIITRNLADYTNATLPVYSPIDFLKTL